MLKLPIGKQTFQKSFLGGDGEIRISSELDAWASIFTSDRPFSRDLDDVAEISLQAGPAGRDLELGEPDGLQMTIQADGAVRGAIRLIWPGDQDDLLAAHDVAALLTPGKLYAAAVLDGTAQASGHFPSGPLSSSFGLGAGGRISYTRLKLYNQTDSARDVLSDLLGGVRLPQAIDEPGEIPAPGEVVALRYGGYLRVKSALHWGYAMAGLRTESIEDLDLVARYEARLAAGLELGYRLAGDFSLEARAGAEPGWVRFVVRKSRTAHSQFAADLGLDADFQLDGLPQSADDFLAALLGTDTRAALDDLRKAIRLGSLDALRPELDALSMGFLQDLCRRWLGKALDKETWNDFQAAASSTLGAWEALDSRIVELYEGFLDRGPELTAMLERLAAVTRREDLAVLEDPLAWQVVLRFWGDRIYDLLLDDTAFEGLRSFAIEALDFVHGEGDERPRGLVQQARASLGHAQLIRRLSAYGSAEALQRQSDARLSAFVDRLLDTSFDRLENTALAGAFEKLHAFLSRLDQFKATWYEALRGAARQSISMQLAYNFTRAGSHDALLDVEIQVDVPGGNALARTAARGDFSRILTVYDPSRVRVHQGVLTHKLESSSTLQINVFGWSWGRTVDLVQNLEHRIDAEEGGLVHVYTLDTQVQQREDHGRRFREEQQSHFLLQAVGAAFQPLGHGPPLDARGNFLLQSLRKLAVEYRLVERDEHSRVEELRETLNLAEYLDLIPSAADVLASLQRQSPEGFGRVEARYVARYDDQAVRSLFAMPDEILIQEARTAVRRAVAAGFTAGGPNAVLADIGFAYLSPAAAQLHAQGILTERAKTVVLPSWFTGDAPREVALGRGRRTILNTLFEVENQLIERLQRLSSAIDRAVSEKESVPVMELQRAARRFVDMADELEKFGRRENTFFAVFDHLVQVGSGGKGRRESALILEITPPGGETITKIFQSAPRRER